MDRFHRRLIGDAPDPGTAPADALKRISRAGFVIVALAVPALAVKWAETGSPPWLPIACAAVIAAASLTLWLVSRTIP